LSWGAGLVLAGCGSSSSDDADRAHFTGAEWMVTGTQMTTCGTGPAESDSLSTEFAFLNNGSGIDYLSAAGCRFEFSVSGDTATLSNAPVSCTDTPSTGDTVEVTFTTYTMTTSDGEHLTVDQTGTVVSGPTTCTFAFTGTGKR
jgi:hypothetical protein